jgi:hypothetical protein
MEFHMATISKAVIQNAKALIGDHFETGDLTKALQLIYNAGYRKGRKDEEDHMPESMYQDAE